MNDERLVISVAEHLRHVERKDKRIDELERKYRTLSGLLYRLEDAVLVHKRQRLVMADSVDRQLYATHSAVLLDAATGVVLTPNDEHDKGDDRQDDEHRDE